MSYCERCGKPTKSSPVSVQSTPVSLGCGTLILIAIIVAVFSNDSKDLEREMRRVRDDVRVLQAAIEKQTAMIERSAVADQAAEPGIPPVAVEPATNGPTSPSAPVASPVPASAVPASTDPSDPNPEPKAPTEPAVPEEPAEPE